MTTPSITIASYAHARTLLGSKVGLGFTHVVSINNPDDLPPPPLRKHPGKHLILNFHDISQESSSASQLAGFVAPQRQDVQRIIDFTETLEDQSEVLCHCAAGISRSSAAALILIASKLDPSVENARKTFQETLGIKKDIHPNLLMTAFADELLDYQGALIAAHNHVFNDFSWVHQVEE